MGNLFGKKNETEERRRRQQSKVSDADRAVLELKVQRDKLRTYERRVAAAVDAEQRAASACVAQEREARAGGEEATANRARSRALHALRRRKHQETVLKRTMDMLSNVEELISTVEFTQVEQQVVDGLRHGSEALKEMQASLADVEDIMADTQEAYERQAEIDEFLSGRLTSVEEAECENELAALERELLGGETGAAGEQDAAAAIDALPDVPSKKPAEKKKVVEEEEEKKKTPVAA